MPFGPTLAGKETPGSVALPPGVSSISDLALTGLSPRVGRSAGSW